MEIGPGFVECESDYPILLAQTGWQLSRRDDVSEGFARALRDQMQADEDQRDGLEDLIGSTECAVRQADWRSKLTAVEDGILRRELFVALPA